MKSVRYGRYTGEDLGLSAEDLMRALSDFFLESGFNDPYFQFSEMNAKTLEDLKRALEQAIERGDMFDPETHLSRFEVNSLLQKLTDAA